MRSASYPIFQIFNLECIWHFCDRKWAFHLASNLFLFSLGRMVIITRSPMEKGFFTWFFSWPKILLSLALISPNSLLSCFTYPFRSSITDTAGAKDKSEGKFGFSPNRISQAETPLSSCIMLFIYSMMEGSRVLHPLPFFSSNMVLSILFRVLWLLSITAFPWG